MKVTAAVINKIMAFLDIFAHEIFRKLDTYLAHDNFADLSETTCRY